MSTAPRQRWRERLFSPVDAASVAAFRIAFGAILLWEVIRYFQYDWIQRYYVTPAFHFTYFGFGWVRPWPGNGMFLHFYVLGGLAVALTLGLCYRAAAALFFLAFTYVFLLEQARYLNHFYLIALFSFLLIAVPAHRIWSLDAVRRPAPTPTIPAWSLWLLQFQVAVPYFYGGLAKINADWLQGEPLRGWMAARADLALIGRFLTHEGVVFLFAYGSLLLDLAITPALLWRRSRPYAFGLACAFHLLNWHLFTIGVFPLFMIAATALFFPPDWPRQIALRMAPGMTALRAPVRLLTASGPTPARFRTAGLALLGMYVAGQLLVPLRHHVYPGDVNWTEEGHRFSWRMKLRDKESDARFVAVNSGTGDHFDVDWRPYLSRWQYNEMANRPDMILQFAHHLGRVLRERVGRHVEVYAIVWTSLNGHRPQILIDPRCDLASRRRDLRPADWILPRSDST
jgi:vitamin K-dependent gamma-carboxylase